LKETETETETETGGGERGAEMRRLW